MSYAKTLVFNFGSKSWFKTKVMFSMVLLP